MVKLALINSKEAVLVHKGHSGGFIGTMYYLLTFMLRLASAMEDLDTFTKWTWAMTAIAQALLLGLLVARRNANIYPAFTAYIFMTLAQGGLLFLAIRGSGFSSLTSYRIGWATQAVVMGARAFAVAELCRHVLGRFRGVWLLARWILLICGTAVLLYALLAADHQLKLLVKQRRARAGTRCSRRDRHAAALRPLLRYYGGAPAPLAGRWPLPVLVRLGSERCHPGTLGQPLRFLLEPSWEWPPFSAACSCGAGRFAAALHKRPPVRCCRRHRIHEYRSGNEFAFALAQ